MIIFSSDTHEAFDSHAGTIAYDNYVTFNGITPVPYTEQNDYHYDLRSFNVNRFITRQTMADLMYQSLGYWGGSGTLTRTVGSMQYSYPNFNLNPTVENWKLSTSGVGDVFLSSTPLSVSMPGGNRILSSVEPYHGYRDYDALSMAFEGTNVSGTFYSSYLDDIYTDFNNEGTDYMISMIVRNAPSQSAALTFDLDKSFIDITFDANGAYDPSKTDSIPFSQFTTLSSANNKDTYIEFNRNQLINWNASKPNITGVRFRIGTRGSGLLTTRFQNMKVYPSGTYTFPPVEVNTKTKRFQASVGVSGTVHNSEMDPIFLYPAQPKNIIQSVKFNIGSKPISYDPTSPILVSNVGSLGSSPLTSQALTSLEDVVNYPSFSGVNEFNLYYRHSIDESTLKVSNIGVTFSSSIDNITLSIFETINDIKTILGTKNLSSVSRNKDYILRTNLFESTITAEIVDINGSFYSTIIDSIGPLTLSSPPRRGYLGWDFKPYSHDFNMVEISPERVEFGTFNSKVLESNRPIIAAQLNTIASQQIAIAEDADFGANGDAFVALNPNGGTPPPDFMVTRSGVSNWIGGVATNDTIFISDTNEIYLSASIYPHPSIESTTTYSGTFRMVLLNKDNFVGYIHNITSIIGNQWNNITMPINANIIPGKYTLAIQNVGYGPITFEIDNIKLIANTISWSATNDGVTYQPFYDEINNEYSVLHFKSPGKKLQLHAAALSDTNNWVESYTLIPIYK